MFAFILALNVIGWLIFILYVMPHHFDYKGLGASQGLGVGLQGSRHRVVPWGFRHRLRR